MSARFRIRTPQGQELSFGSEEMFADFVKSGDVSAGDLVYDASTGEWSPALTHSLVLELRPGGEEGEAPAADVAESQPPDTLEHEPEDPAGRVGGTGDGGLGFELAPEQSPEEAKAKFVEEMEAERASEFERREELLGLKSDESGTGLLREIQRTPPEPPSGEWTPEPPVSQSREEPPGPDRSAPVPPPPSRRTRARPSRRGPLVSGRFVFWVLVSGAAGAGVVLGPDLVALAMNTDNSEVDAVDTGVPILPDTEEALRDRAEVRFLARALQSLSGLPAIPGEWLDGRYLANASEYPGIRAAWNAHLEAVRRLRVDETELYSAAYLSALDDARVMGATRTLRLASALSRFEADRAIRAAHYDRVTELASASIALHDLLVEREESINYEPAVGTRISVDPILQAAGTDPETQQLLEAALDRVLAGLNARGLGPTEASRVRAWAFEGLRDVVAPE
jgi:hypothetical protein